MKIEASLRVAPLVALIEVARDDFFDHLNQFFKVSTMRREVRVFADGHEHSIFCVDIENEFHIEIRSVRTRVSVGSQI